MNLLIHVGYKKTGTTWLQTCLFNNAEIGFCSPFTADEIKSALIYPTDDLFDAKTAHNFFATRLSETWQAGKIPVISREGLSSTSRNRSYSGQETARRLRTTFSAAKILVVIREQRAMLLSHYKYLVKSGRVYAPLEEILRKPSEEFGLLALQRYNYQHLIRGYQQLFGVDNVLVLPYELFCRRPVDFVREIVIFGGRDVSEKLLVELPYTYHTQQALPESTIVIKRIINRFVKPKGRQMKRFDKQIETVLRNLDGLLPHSFNKRLHRKMQECVYHCVGDYYQSSNLETAAIAGLDLAQYGYDLPEHNIAGWVQMARHIKSGP